MSETDALTKAILVEASRNGHRMFRQNVGQGWVGEVVRRDRSLITLANYRPFHAGLVTGSGDIIGPTREGLFANLEVKVGADRVRREQAAFDEMVRGLGGRSGIVRSVEEAMAVLEGRAGPLLAR